MLSASASSDLNPTSRLNVQPFGTTAEGAEVLHFWLENRSGLRVGLTNFGGVLTHLEVPDRDGRFADVLLGFDSFEPYRENPAYFGAVVGRYANRIAGGAFSLHGEVYRLATNNARAALSPSWRRAGLGQGPLESHCDN